MFEIVAFCVVCLIWQEIKNSIRGPRVPTVSLRETPSVTAKCGCKINQEKNHVVAACAAHKVLSEL